MQAGLNRDGQLGDAITPWNYSPLQSPTPLRIKVAGASGKWSGVYSGSQHTCATDAADNGAVWCWGANDNGQLGDGTVFNAGANTAVRVLPPSSDGGGSGGRFTILDGGLKHTCAIWLGN